jgi:hypothetical protein
VNADAPLTTDTTGTLEEETGSAGGGASEGGAPSGAAHAAGDDKFYHGVIEQVSWSKGTGSVRSRNGREIPFDFSLVTMVGERRRIEHLQPGMRVGFDVGWTSHGLRVTALKIYD